MFHHLIQFKSSLPQWLYNPCYCKSYLIVTTFQGSPFQAGVNARLSPSLKRKGLLPPIAKTDSFIAKPEFSDVAYQINSAAKASKSWMKGKNM